MGRLPDPSPHLRAAGVALLLLAWTVLLIPVQAAALALRSPLSRVVPKLYHRGVSRTIGIDIHVAGCRAGAPPTLYVCNHASYVDIIVLSCVLDAAFVAKAEVAGWPLFGLLAKLARSVFVVRRASRSERHRDEIRRRLQDGDSLILFPEGTSSDGNRVLPFNSTFFAVAQRPLGGGPLAVQPVSLAYTGFRNLPMSRRERPWATWYGDTALFGHLWRLMGLGGVRVDVWLHEPVTIESHGSRKALARACETAVADGLSALLAGRRPRRVGDSTPLDSAPGADKVRPGGGVRRASSIAGAS